jgi:hypothetical protein
VGASATLVSFLYDTYENLGVGDCRCACSATVSNSGNRRPVLSFQPTAEPVAPPTLRVSAGKRSAKGLVLCRGLRCRSLRSARSKLRPRSTSRQTRWACIDRPRTTGIGRIDTNRIRVSSTPTEFDGHDRDGLSDLSVGLTFGEGGAYRTVVTLGKPTSILS